MTTLYFVIAALAALGAVTLLWLDRRRESTPAVDPRRREGWAQARDFDFRTSDPALVRRFTRGAVSDTESTTVSGVAEGEYHGTQALVFDLGEATTLVAVRGTVSSSVLIDLRDEDAYAPAETDLEPVGAMGRRVLFSNDVEIARRVCDRRMAGLSANAPNSIEILWNEGQWALASMARTDDPKKLDIALETVRRFGDLLRVLPPSVSTTPRRAPANRDPLAPVSGRMRAVDLDARDDEAGQQPSGQDTYPPPRSPRQRGQDQDQAWRSERFQPGSLPADGGRATRNGRPVDRPQMQRTPPVSATPAQRPASTQRSAQVPAPRPAAPPPTPNSSSGAGPVAPPSPVRGRGVSPIPATRTGRHERSDRPTFRPSEGDS